jgi:hypothetical protein
MKATLGTSRISAVTAAICILPADAVMAEAARIGLRPLLEQREGLRWIGDARGVAGDGDLAVEHRHHAACRVLVLRCPSRPGG